MKRHIHKKLIKYLWSHGNYIVGPGLEPKQLDSGVHSQKLNVLQVSCWGHMLPISQSSLNSKHLNRLVYNSGKTVGVQLLVLKSIVFLGTAWDCTCYLFYSLIYSSCPASKWSVTFQHSMFHPHLMSFGIFLPPCIFACVLLTAHNALPSLLYLGSIFHPCSLTFLIHR